MKSILITGFILFTCASSSNADWVARNNPRKGQVLNIHAHRSENNMLFTQLSGYTHEIKKTITGGASWYTCGLGVGENMKFAPSSNDIIYTSTHRSIDGGESWVALTDPPGIQLSFKAIHPNHPDTVLATGFLAGIYKTANGGQNWSLMSSIDVSRIAYDNITPDTAYALSSYYEPPLGHVYKSVNGGTTWDIISNDTLPDRQSLIIDQHVLYSLANRQDWTLTQFQCWIARSSDGGVNWEMLGLTDQNYPIHKIYDFALNSGIMFATTDQGLYQSFDNGVIWYRISPDYDELNCLDVYQNNIFIGSRNAGVMKAQINPLSWCNIGIDILDYITVEMHSSVGNHQICTDGQILYKYNMTSDGWHTIIPPHRYPGWNSGFGITFISNNSNHVYCVSNDNYIYYSDTGGISWDSIAATTNWDRILIVSIDENKFFIKGLNNTVIRSLNRGVSWSIKQTPTTWLKDIHYSDQNRLYIFGHNGNYMSMWYSDNNGDTWNLLDSGLPPNSWSGAEDKINFDPNNNDRLFAIIDSGPPISQGVYEKSAGSLAWQQIYQFQYGIPEIIGHIEVDPAGSDLYAVGRQSSIYYLFRSRDGGASWETVSDFVGATWETNYTFAQYPPYEMWIIDQDGNFWSGDVQNMLGVNGQKTDFHPLSFILHPPSPNPFNPSTTLTFTLPHAGEVWLQVFDIQGRAVGALLAAPQTGGASTTRAGQALPLHAWYPAGTHSVTFDGSDLPSGMYFARLQATEGGFGPGEFSQTRKLVLLK